MTTLQRLDSQSVDKDLDKAFANFQIALIPYLLDTNPDTPYGVDIPSADASGDSIAAAAPAKSLLLFPVVLAWSFRLEGLMTGIQNHLSELQVLVTNTELPR